MADKKELSTQPKVELTPSERFSNHVLRDFGSQVAGEIGATDYQRQLIQGYFIGIDRALKVADENRIKKNESNTNKSYNNDHPINWNTINLPDLALDVVHYAKMGLDMIQPNHLTVIPYRNKKTNQYDVTFIKGYNGIQYIAEKYALNKPKNVVTELVYSSDNFKPIKKNVGNDVESYEFEITNPFDRGNIVGGFGYIEYPDPKDNKLIIMTMRDIEKRKPKYASAEFWGGKKKEWVNGKQVEVETDGWFEEMCMKTLKRYVYGQIEIDPKKVDDSYQYMKMAEMKYVEMETHAMIEENANTEEFVLPDSIEAEKVEGEVIEEAKQESLKGKKAKTTEKVDDSEPEFMKG